MSSHFFGRLFGQNRGGGHHGGGHGERRGYGYPREPAAEAPWGNPGGVACPKCRADNADGSRFCAQCGERLAHSPQTCKCGAILPPEAKFCSSCGAAKSSP